MVPMQWRGVDPAMQGVLVSRRVAAGVWERRTRLCGCTAGYTATIGEIAACRRSLELWQGFAHASMRSCSRRNGGAGKEGREDVVPAAVARRSVAGRRGQAGRARAQGKIRRDEATGTTRTAMRAQAARVAEGVGGSVEGGREAGRSGSERRRPQAFTRSPWAAKEGGEDACPGGRRRSRGEGRAVRTWRVRRGVGGGFGAQRVRGGAERVRSGCGERWRGRGGEGLKISLGRGRAQGRPPPTPTPALALGGPMRRLPWPSLRDRRGTGRTGRTGRTGQDRPGQARTWP